MYWEIISLTASDKILHCVALQLQKVELSARVLHLQVTEGLYSFQLSIMQSWLTDNMSPLVSCMSKKNYSNLFQPSEELSGVDKEQNNITLSSEDEELLNQKLASESTESTVQDVREKKKTDTVEVVLGF